MLNKNEDERNIYDSQNGNEKKFYETAKDNFNNINEDNNDNQYNLDDVVKSFNYFDINQNGKVGLLELKKILCNFGQKMTEEEFDKILKSVGIDQNNIDDENIDYMELINLWINKN